MYFGLLAAQNIKAKYKLYYKYTIYKNIYYNYIIYFELNIT